jgi:hypothetical protein
VSLGALALAAAQHAGQGQFTVQLQHQLQLIFEQPFAQIARQLGALQERQTRGHEAQLERADVGQAVGSGRLEQRLEACAVARSRALDHVLFHLAPRGAFQQRRAPLVR